MFQYKPLVHPQVREFVNEADKIDDLTSAMGSPLHVVFPTIVEENIKDLEECLNKMN